MKLSWIDSIGFKATLSDKGRSFFDDVSSDKSAYIETTIRSTHSGQLITGRCYTGWGMKAGTKSWYALDKGGSAAYDKPHITNHDMSKDPIGRVVFADFTQLKHGDDWLNDWRRPDSGPGKFGSGYITTVSKITDPEAMRKVIDGRFSTVSTRQVADKAWCSRCGNEFSDGCEHEIGMTYDGEICYAVTGLLDYVEISFVNHPRQPNAKVLSFKEMRDALTAKDKDGVVLVGDCLYESDTDFMVKLRSNKDYQITVNLADEDLPSTSLFTGRTQVFMPANVKLKGFDEAVNEAEKLDKEKTADSAEEKSVDGNDEFDFVFANLARAWKDDLDLKTPFKDSTYFYGITDKSSGHAHVFDGFLDSKNKVVRGSTSGTGQGKAQESHHHAIWVEGLDMNQPMVKGETRSASAGPDHMHAFSASMSDAENKHGTLISGIDAIEAAIKELEDRVNKDTLSSEFKGQLLDAKSPNVSWDAAHKAAAAKLMGRLSEAKRFKVLEQMFAKDLEDKPEEESSMDKSTSDKVITDLLADKARLTQEVRDAVSLSDAKEADRVKLLDENVSLKASVLKLKANLVVSAREKLTGTKLDDEARKSAITDLASKDEAALDALIDSEVLGNVRKEVASAPAPVQKTGKEVVNGAQMSVVEDSQKPAPKRTEPSSSTKSLIGLDRRVTSK